MSARVEGDAPALAPDAELVAYAALPPSIALDPDDRWGGHALPHDHPAWMKDTLSISQRTRALLGRLRPVVVKVIAFWEHRVRSIAIGDRRLCVDPSGSYRLE